MSSLLFPTVLLTSSTLREKVIASEGMVGMQAELLELLNSVDKKLDYRNFLAATMEKVRHQQ